MSRSLLLMVLLLPLLASAQKGFSYSYLLNVSNVESTNTMKLVFEVIHDLDNTAQISYNDDLDELKVRSNVRLERNDFSLALQSLGVTVSDFRTPKQYGPEPDPGENGPAPIK